MQSGVCSTCGNTVSYIGDDTRSYFARVVQALRAFYHKNDLR